MCAHVAHLMFSVLMLTIYNFISVAITVHCLQRDQALANTYQTFPKEFEPRVPTSPCIVIETSFYGPCRFHKISRARVKGKLIRRLFSPSETRNTFTHY